jgi:transcriptional regulator with GAF, ATPase, and Fis domain
LRGIDVRLGVEIEMIGQSPAFLATLARIERLAACDAPVVIEGETGTGKELAARAIHYGSGRRDKPFVPVNCGALPDSLIENELFGHTRGAFTDAANSCVGLLRLAHMGTLFLDEVDALAPRGQVALLRFLQDGRFRPLGSGREEAVDVRVIVASNRPLEALTNEGAFRQDLFFRLRVLSLLMPPLRERCGDPILLATHFVRRCAAQYHSRERPLDAPTRAWLNVYPWPGNVRELENLVTSEFLTSDDGELHLRPAAGARSTAADPALPAALMPVRYSLARTRALESFDRAYLQDVLRRSHGNVTEAARLAGKERRALGKLLRKHQISTAPFRH